MKSRSGAGWIVKTAELFQNEMEWETMVKVARVLQDDATTAEAELTAATEAAKAISYLVKTGHTHRLGRTLDRHVGENREPQKDMDRQY